MPSKIILSVFIVFTIGFATSPSHAGDLISCDSFENCPDGSVPLTNALLALEARMDALEPRMDALEPPDPPCFNTTQRFVDCANGTVTDTVTGLIYLKNAQCFGLQNWPTANESAAGLADDTCGLTDGSRAGDWRLQTREEWEGILMQSCTTDPEIVGNQSPVPGCYSDANDADSEWASGVVTSFYWSSTTVETNTTNAWYVTVANGSVSLNDKGVGELYVWPVRGGQ